jgi:hypothetical protein
MKGDGAVPRSSHEGRAPTSIPLLLLQLQQCKRRHCDESLHRYLSSIQLIASNNVIDFVPVIVFTLPPRSLTALYVQYCIACFSS